MREILDCAFEHKFYPELEFDRAFVCNKTNERGVKLGVADAIYFIYELGGLAVENAVNKTEVEELSGTITALANLEKSTLLSSLRKYVTNENQSLAKAEVIM